MPNSPSVVTPYGSALPLPGGGGSASLMDQAKSQYPYLADKDISYYYSPNPSAPNGLEFYSPTEVGTPQDPRPSQLPLGKPGIQVFNANVRPIDILGDYVSHHAVTNDPRLQKMYQQFVQSVPAKTMQDRYQYHVQNFGEKRPYEEWLQQSGMPEYFRGYTFNQWGPEAKGMYSPEQLKTLDQIRNYLGIK